MLLKTLKHEFLGHNFVLTAGSQAVSEQQELSKILGFHGGNYEEWRLLGCKTPVCTSQETHYVSTTESSQLMLCKIWGFHGCDYEECPLLLYKTPVRTSQKTHHVSDAELSPLMICRIWGFLGGNYKEWSILGCYVVWLLWEPHGVNISEYAILQQELRRHINQQDVRTTRHQHPLISFFPLPVSGLLRTNGSAKIHTIPFFISISLGKASNEILYSRIT
jgi:hypothetical protein